MVDRRAAQAKLAAELLAGGRPAHEALAAIAAHNRDIHRAVLESCMAGRTPAPAGFTGLILGSGGRGESFLHPDQDNAFILDDYPDEEHGRVDRWFVALAKEFIRALDAAGFPLCKGNVMASNPVWRKTRTQWRDQVSIWVRKRSPVAVLYADIFLDFAPFAGDPGRASELRGHVLQELRRHPALLGDMALAHAQTAVGLGLFGRLPGHLDLKLRGLMPLVGAVRLLALRAGIAETATPARIAALRSADVFDRDTAAAAAAAFDTMGAILLRQQIADHAAGRTPGNDIAPHDLDRPRQRALSDALHTAERLQHRARADVTGLVL